MPLTAFDAAQGWEPYTVDSEPKPVGYSVGVDLGQVRDFTAVTVVELHHFTRVTKQKCKLTGYPLVLRDQKLTLHKLRFTERMPLGTSYSAQARRVAEVMTRLPPLERKPVLIVDQTGVGRPVLDAMREIALRPIGVTFTHGVTEVEANWDDWRVPKKVLISLLGVLLDGRRIKFADDLVELDTLTREMANLRLKVTSSRNETFEAWREREHDDLVFATALACWGTEKRMPEPARMVRLDWMSR